MNLLILDKILFVLDFLVLKVGDIIMNKSRITLLLIFLAGLLIVAFHDLIFSFTAISDIGGLILGIIISIFGGSGYLMDLYKN